MSDTIYRAAAIEAIKKADYVIVYNGAMTQEEVIEAATDTLIAALTRDIEELPSAQPDLDEWCTDCKEYDHEKHCCPRFCRVIRTTVEELKQDAQTERQMGHWIEDGYSHHKAVCDQCGEPCGTYAAGKPRDRFCKWCGADMRGEQDEADRR